MISCCFVHVVAVRLVFVFRVFPWYHGILVQCTSQQIIANVYLITKLFSLLLNAHMQQFYLLLNVHMTFALISSRCHLSLLSRTDPLLADGLSPTSGGRRGATCILHSNTAAMHILIPTLAQ